MDEMHKLEWLDYAVVVIYALIIGGIGLWVSRKQKTTDEYFIANRSIPTWAVAFTMMATLIGSGTIVGHPATVYQKSMILLLGILTLPIVLYFVAYFIVPFYRNVVHMSAYEYIGTRFGQGGRIYSSFGFLADRIFDLGVTLITTAIPISYMTHWNLPAVILGMGIFTILYTAIGGIEAVVWTNVVQGVILIGGAVLILARLIFAPEVGAPGAVVVEAYHAGKFSLGSFELSWDSLFDIDTTTQWLFILAFAINWGRRYITDQHMVQRFLIAKSNREARNGTLWNAFACVPIFVTFMFIGACLYGYYSLSDHPGPELADNVVPHFLIHELPPGIVGLILAAILAASMSSISGDLNSVATVLTTDYYANFLPNTSDKMRLFFGRAMVIVGGTLAALVGLLLIPDENTASILERAVTIAAILSGGTLGLFMLGFLSRRATREGCYIGIAACLIFTAWGILTEPKTRILDMGFNFEMNPILIGVLGHVVLFGVGYVASLVVGGYVPADVDELTFRRKKSDD